MGTYKISGSINQSARIRIFEGETYRGYKDVSPGNYEVIFNSNSGENMTAKAETIDGETIGFGNITAISGSFSTDITLYPTEIFTSNDTWTKPEGVENVLVILAGGGGGGSDGSSTYGGAGGGGGACITQIVDVTSLSSVPVTIGTGGAANSDGAASTFGALITSNGGKRGYNDSVAGEGGGIGGGSSRSGHYTASRGSDGAYGLQGNDASGTGGGGSYGAGGNGGSASGGNGTNGTYGGGGGGGGDSSGSGAAGGDGICIVIPILHDSSVLP